MIRVLLVDDQVLFVESLKSILEIRTEDITVLGIAKNGLEAIEMVRREQPDIILMDVRMPLCDGVEASKVILSEFPKSIIMMLTTFDDDQYVRESFHYGVKGYVLKDIPPNELVICIKAIHGGIMQISPSIAGKMVLRDDPETVAAVPDYEEWKEKLSSREAEIIELIIDGMSNKEIAFTLKIAEQTVKNYLTTIYDKLGVHGRTQIFKKVMEKQKHFSP
jgi:DNA-binding NarL/FixJ family response regulator